MAPKETNSEEQIHKLSEQVQLQIAAYEAMAEVYEKYSLALARIMDLLRQLHESGKESDQSLENHLSEIVTCVAVVGESIKHAEESIRIDNSVFSKRLNDLVISLNDVISKVETTGDNIEEFKETTFAFYKLTSENSKNTFDMIQDLHTQSQNQIDFWKRWRIWMYAICGILGFLQALIQLGLLKLTWFN